MKDQVERWSTFWEWSYHATDFAHLAWPFLLSAAIVVLAWRSRSAWAAIALVGVSLVLAGHVTHISAQELTVTSMGGYAQPAEGVSPLVVFFSLHALHLGMLVTVFALGMYALRSMRHV